MKCTNCGAELYGKFCTVCGTPAPQQEIPQPVVEPVQYNPAPQQEAPQPVAEPVQYNPAPQQEAPQPIVEPVQYNPAPQQEAPQPIVEPVQYNPAPQQEAPQPVVEPVQYNPAPQQEAPQPIAEPVQCAQPQPQQQYTQTTQGSDFSQQYQNYYGGNPVNQNGYTGQQFTNQPYNPNVNPQGKKPMSTGKIVGIVLGIVGGVILLACILIGVAACNFAKNTSNLFDSVYDKYYSYDFDDFMSNNNAQYNVEDMITCGGEYWFVD